MLLENYTGFGEGRKAATYIIKENAVKESIDSKKIHK